MTILLILASMLAAPLAAQFRIDGTSKPRPGEKCVICNSQLGDDDVVFVVNGQRFGVMKDMKDEFLRDVGVYVKQRQPEGMLFTGTPAPTMDRVYFWLGALLLLGVLCGGYCAHLAMDRGAPPGRWFALGFLLSVPAALILRSRPLSAGAAAIGALDRVPSTRAPAACPACGFPNHPAASQCNGCEAPLARSVEPESGRA